MFQTDFSNFFRTLLEERRLYRRDEKGQVVKGQDHLQDAARCLVLGLSEMITEPEEDEEEPRWTTNWPIRGHDAWMR